MGESKFKTLSYFDVIDNKEIEHIIKYNNNYIFLDGLEAIEMKYISNNIKLISEIQRRYVYLNSYVFKDSKLTWLDGKYECLINDKMKIEYVSFSNYIKINEICYDSEKLAAILSIISEELAII